MTSYAAFDLGASQGRGILARFDGERLHLEEIHRFENRPIELMGHLHWDALYLYSQIKAGLQKMRSTNQGGIASLGVDTWGCDFALLDQQGKLIGNPYCYRDPQTAGIFDYAFQILTREEIFAQTGLQFMELNSLFQLLAMQKRCDPVLDAAHTFLHISDLMHYWLTGEKVSEYTNASTSHLLDVIKRDWAYPLIRAFGLPEHIFPPVVKPGTPLGRLRPALAEELGLPDLEITATATHDTAAAIVATPVDRSNFAYLSSGTWGLLGQEVPRPLLTPECLRLNITNEGGAFDNITLLKNIANLWLIQECRRHWNTHGNNYTWDDLVEAARQAPEFLAFLDPDDRQFLAPGNMPARVQAYCAATKQAVPQTPGEITRVILESLAMKYRYTLNRVQAVSGQDVDTFHIIGGGSQNRLLNQFTANATGRRVVAGPSEATAAGNVLVQMVARGDLSSPEEARELSRRSFPTEEFLPQDRERWDAAYERFLTATVLAAVIL
jgi:sugar (pentulose or hexulose) kinase